MVTTRNGALKERRVTRSMAAPKATSSGVVKHKTTVVAKTALKTAQKSKKSVLKKQNVTEREPASGDRAVADTNREMHTTTVNNDTTIRAVTKSMSEKGDQTAIVKPSASSKKISVNATRGKGAPTKPSSKPSSRSDASAASAARPTTRSMATDNEDFTTAAPSGLSTQVETDLTPAPRRMTRQTAIQNALPTASTATSAPVDDVQARLGPSATRTSDPPRARRTNARTMITPRVIRPGLTITITAGQERYWLARTRASLRRALEGDQEWPRLTHGQRREMIRMFAWVESQPGRTHHDYFNLPIRHEALTTKPMVNMSGFISRVRAWYESLKTGTNDEEEEAVDDEGNGVIEED